ncbi:MAG TPA: GNAT family N-acetyltransferase [Actinomycetota bacterium]
MNKDFLIRAATEADARAIAEIHVGGWLWAYRGLVPDGLLDSLSVDRREEGWRRGFADHRPGRAVFVAERDARAIGFVACGRSMDDDAAKGCGEVYAIYIEHEVQGTGVGRALLARAVQHLREYGFRQATLWVLANNDRTRRFYEVAGWRPDGTEKTDEWHGFPLREARYRIEFPAG